MMYRPNIVRRKMVLALTAGGFNVMADWTKSFVEALYPRGVLGICKCDRGQK